MKMSQEEKIYRSSIESRQFTITNPLDGQLAIVEVAKIGTSDGGYTVSIRWPIPDVTIYRKTTDSQEKADEIFRNAVEDMRRAAENPELVSELLKDWEIASPSSAVMGSMLGPEYYDPKVFIGAVQLKPIQDLWKSGYPIWLSSYMKMGYIIKEGDLFHPTQKLLQEGAPEILESPEEPETIECLKCGLPVGEPSDVSNIDNIATISYWKTAVVNDSGKTQEIQDVVLIDSAFDKSLKIYGKCKDVVGLKSKIKAHKFGNRIVIEGIKTAEVVPPEEKFETDHRYQLRYQSDEVLASMLTLQEIDRRHLDANIVYSILYPEQLKKVKSNRKKSEEVLLKELPADSRVNWYKAENWWKKFLSNPVLREKVFPLSIGEEPSRYKYAGKWPLVISVKHPVESPESYEMFKKWYLEWTDIKKRDPQFFSRISASKNWEEFKEIEGIKDQEEEEKLLDIYTIEASICKDTGNKNSPTTININVGDNNKGEIVVKPRELPEISKGVEIRLKGPGKEEKESKKKKFRFGDLVQLKMDPSVKGIFLEVQDSKSGDVDGLIYFFKPQDGERIIEVPPTDLELSEEKATKEQLEDAKKALEEYHKKIKEYNKSFDKIIKQKKKEEKKEEKEEDKAEKEAYIAHMPGHKNSEGKPAPWVIKDHKTHKVLQSFKTKEEAEDALKRMKYFKHKKGESEDIGEKEKIVKRLEEIDEQLAEVSSEWENEIERTFREYGFNAIEFDKLYDENPNATKRLLVLGENILKKFDKSELIETDLENIDKLLKENESWELMKKSILSKVGLESLMDLEKYYPEEAEVLIVFGRMLTEELHRKEIPVSGSIYEYDLGPWRVIWKENQEEKQISYAHLGGASMAAHRLKQLGYEPRVESYSGKKYDLDTIEKHFHGRPYFFASRKLRRFRKLPRMISKLPSKEKEPQTKHTLVQEKKDDEVKLKPEFKKIPGPIPPEPRKPFLVPETRQANDKVLKESRVQIWKEIDGNIVRLFEDGKFLTPLEKRIIENSGKVWIGDLVKECSEWSKEDIFSNKLIDRVCRFFDENTGRISKLPDIEKKYSQYIDGAVSVIRETLGR